VAGLPEPRRDHAEVMARFAHDILKRLVQTTSELGKTLGPGTSSLTMRVGVRFIFYYSVHLHHDPEKSF
jgi:hypothetical protein